MAELAKQKFLPTGRRQGGSGREAAFRPAQNETSKDLPASARLQTEKRPCKWGAEDTNVVRLLKQRNPEGLSRVMHDYHARLFSVAEGICCNHSDTEEVLQDVYMSVVTNIDRFQEKSTLYSWLYRITVNAALMKLRGRRKDRRTVSMETTGAMADEDSCLPGAWGGTTAYDVEVLARELLEKIAQSADSLPAIYQGTFLLSGLGFSVKETSEVLQTTRAAIKSRLRRARVLVRAGMGEYLDAH